MVDDDIERRRFLGISVAAAGAALTGRLAGARPPIEAPRIGWVPRQPRVAFGAAGVAHLGRQRLAVWAIGKQAPDVELALKAPRALCALTDGSLIVVDEHGYDPKVVHVATGATQTHPAVSLGALPRGLARVVADPLVPDAFWYFGDARATARRMSLKLLAGSLTLEALVTLERTDRGPLCATANGGLAFWQTGELRTVARDHPHAVSRLKWQKDRCVRLSPSDGAIWAALEGGKLVRAELGDPVRSTEIATLPGEVFDLDVAGDLAAMIQLNQSFDHAPRWTLVVYQADGKTRLRQPLPWGGPTVSVAISADHASVAVATADRIAVWDTTTGRQTLQR